MNQMCKRRLFTSWKKMYSVTLENVTLPPATIGVERPTENPGAILTRFRVPGAARALSPRDNFQCRFSYGVCTVPRTQAHASTSDCSYICAHVKTLKHWQPYTTVWTHGNAAHTHIHTRARACTHTHKQTHTHTYIHTHTHTHTHTHIHTHTHTEE